MTTLNQKCIICYAAANTKLPTLQSQRCDIRSDGILRWKLLTVESFCMMFGLPVNVNQALIAIFTGNRGKSGAKIKEGPLLCNKCLQDMSDVHFIYWQLCNLEVKLIKLQRIIFNRLDASWGNTQQNGPFEDHRGEILQSWFKDIKSRSHLWPEGVYISKWKEAEANVDSLVSNTGAYEHLPRETEVKRDPEYYNMSSPEEMEDFNEDYVQNDDVEGVNDPFDDIDNNDLYHHPKRRKKQKSRVLHHYSTDSNGKYLCTEDPAICSRTYDTKKLLTNHVKSFHEGRVHICDEEGCAQKFKSELTLIHHKRRIHGLIIETTIKPKRWIIDKDELLMGELNGNEEVFLCKVDPSICNRMFRRLKDLNTHVQQFHEGRNFSCDEEGCMEKFKSKGRLSGHKRNAHGGINRILKKKMTKKVKMEEKCQKNLTCNETSKVCDICGVTVSTKNMWNHHKVYHSGFSRFKCEFCSMDFSDPDQFKSHENLHTKLSNTLPFTCVASGCTEILTNSFDLKRHVTKNHLSSGLKCEICGIMKSNQYLLKRHFKSHQTQITGSSVICDECGKSYNSESSLKTHKATFHNGKQFGCNICKMVFKSGVQLTRHKRLHKDRLKCSVCGKGFVQQQNLRKHEEIHSGTKKYECHLCGKRFKQSQNLKQHLRTQAHQPRKNSNQNSAQWISDN